jgi:hypothetical protein
MLDKDRIREKDWGDRLMVSKSVSGVGIHRSSDETDSQNRIVFRNREPQPSHIWIFVGFFEEESP